MVLLRRYGYRVEEDLRNLIAKKFGPSEENIIYLGKLDGQRIHVYHIFNATGLVWSTTLSLAAISEDEIEKAKRSLEEKLEIKLLEE